MAHSRVSRIVGRLVGFVDRHPWAIVLAAAAIAGTAIWLASRLEVEQDLQVLLPPDAPSIQRLDALSERMGNLSDLVVEIRSPSREANIRFGEAIDGWLEARDDVRYSLFHQDRAYFEDHALLYLSIPDLLDLRTRVIERIKEEVTADLIEGFEDDGGGEDAPSDGDASAGDELGLDGDALRERYAIDRRVPEYFEADEGRVMAVKARPQFGTTDVSKTEAMLAEVEAEIARLDPGAFHPEMKVTIQGGYASRRKQVGGIAGDAQRGGIAAAILLILCLWAYFRRFRNVPLVMLPLLVSVVTALGYAQLRFGFLNLVSAFIFAVLLGIGIDFGLHILGRYEHERLRAHGRAEALRIALSTTGMSTLTGACSTIGVYGVLMLADFQGFAQFGELAAVGILAAVVSVFTVVPAAVTLFERRFPWRPGRRQHIVEAAASGALPPPRPPSGRMVAGAAVALAIGGGWATYSAVNAPDIAFEYDFQNLGPRPSDDAANDDDDDDVASYKDAIGKESTYGPAVALTRDLEQTEWLHRLLSDGMGLTPHQVAHLDAVRAGTYEAPEAPEAPEASEAPDDADEPDGGRAEPEAPDAPDDGDDWADDGDDWADGGDDWADGAETADDPYFAALAAETEREANLSAEARARLAHYSDGDIAVMQRMLVQVFSIFTFVPERQDDKLRIVRDIRRRIDAKRARLREDTRRELEDADRYLAVDAPVRVADLPAWVRVQFVDDGGELGRFVVFRSRGSKADYEVTKVLHEAFFDLETPTGTVPTAGNMYVMPEMLDSVAADGPVVIGLALAVAAIAALLLFRSLFGLGAVLLTVALGVLWLVGLMELLEWKANFFNLIAIPLLIGMGQDYALHLYHRYSQEGVGRIWRVIRETGGAVFMTTLTTAIGFGGILFANHRGLQSLAWSSVAGLVFCFIASVVILPAIVVLAASLGRKPSTAG